MKNDWEVSIKWNVKLFYLINSRRNSFLDKFYKYFFYMGKSYSIPVYILIFYIFLKDFNFLNHLIVSLLITGIIMPALKYTIRHKRPSALLENVNLLEPVSLKSFPSADSGYVFTIFTVSLFYGNIYLSLILLIIALIIGYGRVYMGAHFPLDVLVGYFFGFLAGILGNYLIKFIP